jgi:hypothetical protein
MKNLNFKKDLTNFDIMNICNALGIKLNGVYMRDEIPSKLLDGNYIINLESHSEAGSHWCGFFKSKNNIYWFDAFGAPPPQDEMEIFQQEHDNIYYSNIQIQDINSILCGYFVIAFLYFINKSSGSIAKRISKYQQLFNLDNQKGNDKILISLFRQF